MSISAESINTAINELKSKSKPRKFTQTFDITVNLKDMDMNKPQNRINAEIILPNPVKQIKICVIAHGDLAFKAEKAGADKIIDKDELAKLGSDRKLLKRVAKEYDYFIVGIDMMGNVARSLGPVLGPLGKMPLAPPKGEGVIQPNADIEPILEKYRRTIKIRMKKNPIIQTIIGNEKMEPKGVYENLQALLSYLEEHLEKGSRNIKSIVLKYTQSPPIKLKLGK